MENFWAALKDAAPILGSTSIYSVIKLLPIKSKQNTAKVHHNPVDRHDVPVPHFGVVLEMDQWNRYVTGFAK